MKLELEAQENVSNLWKTSFDLETDEQVVEN